MTNEEWIRQLSHKELIHFLCDLMGDGCGRCPFRAYTNACTIRLWLSSEHQECEFEVKEREE